ncbi:MAG: OmpA family protein [Thermonemataceae bacterium]|nr:OmpA family protein [Thermonemataceae bacterium]
MFQKIFFSLLVCFAFVASLKAQETYNTKNKGAIKLYEEAQEELRKRYKTKQSENRYDEAMELFEKAVKKDPNFTEAHLALAQNYQIFGKYYDKMIYHYEQAVKSSPTNKKVIKAYYTLAGEMLKQGKYEKARKYAEGFLAFAEGAEVYTKEAERIIACTDFAKTSITNALPFQPKSLGEKINQKNRLQYFPVLTADQNTIFFTAIGLPKKGHSEDIFVSIKTEGVWSEPMLLSKKINTDENEGTCSISADGKTIVFTSCQGRQSFGSCDLYISEMIGKEWTEPINMGQRINSPFWDSQPSLSADGNTLYFISDRNRRSGMDIYVSHYQKEIGWSEAMALPETINTNKDEFSPFIHANGKTLFFSSNGHIGLGGWDLFSSELENNEWSKPKNLGYPINNHLDQVSLCVSADGKKGYYADEKRKGNVDISAEILEFDMPEPVTVRIRTQYLKGRVFDAQTKEVLEAQIDLINLANNQKENAVQSDKYNGEYLLVLNEKTEYALEINKKGYAFKSLRFDYSNKKVDDIEPIILDIYLSPLEKGTIFVLNNVFFDSGKWDLEAKSRAELDELIRFMQENPQVKGEISGHTDNVGDKKTNIDLSLKRAKSVYQYLLQGGIESKRLVFKGYGDSQPKAPNDTEENKQLNRRIEFKIL